MAKKEINETLKKLNESFGQYDSSTNIAFPVLSLYNKGNEKPLKEELKMAKKEINETLKKLNESFGQYDSSTNIDTEYSISPNSEDDKPQTGKPDLSLKDDGIGNNDWQQRFSDPGSGGRCHSGTADHF